MSGPDDPQDFSPRRGGVWAPALILALAILIAAISLVAQHRFWLQTNPPVPARTTPTQPAPIQPR